MFEKIIAKQCSGAGDRPVVPTKCNRYNGISLFMYANTKPELIYNGLLRAMQQQNTV